MPERSDEALSALVDAGTVAARPDPVMVPSGSAPSVAAPMATLPAIDITALEPVTAGPLPLQPWEAGPATVPPNGAPTPSTAGPHSHRRRRHRRRLRWGLGMAMVVLLGAAGGVARQRINSPMAPPVLHSSIPASLLVPGSRPTLPWPTVGQGAVFVPALGYAQQSGPELPVPIASLTKMANAVVILRDHPMAPGTDGPVITITAGDAQEYRYDLNNDESNVPIKVGETLTELQMLEALLTESANDIAYSLAVWDAGSEPAFVAKMNALATSLGASHTHYVDASGFDPLSVSTAADSLRVAAAGMSIPTFATVVGMSTVTLPLVGTAHNIVSEIGSNGVVGVKSGYTSQAGGCIVLAGYRTIRGRSVLVLASALGQKVPAPVAPKPSPTTTTAGGSAPPQPAPSAPPSTAPPSTAPTPTTTTVPTNDLEILYPLLYAGPIVEKLLDASKAAVVPVPVATRGLVLISATSTWNGMAHQVTVATSRGAWLLGWPGQVVDAAVKIRAVPPGAAAGTGAGNALYALGMQIQTVPLRLTDTVPEPSRWWRLVHG